MNGLRSRIVVQVDGQMKTGRDVVDRRAARRRGVRLRHRAAGRLRLRDDARLPPQHLPGRHRDAGSGAARALHRQAGVRRALLPLHRRGSARADGRARLPHPRRDDRPRRSPRRDQGARRTGRRAASTTRRSSSSRRCRPNAPLRCVSSQDHGLDKALDNELIARARPAIEQRAPVAFSTPIRNVNRTVGTLLGYEVTEAVGRGGPARRDHPHPLHRPRRPELRRVPAQGHHADARRRRQRLRRQGPVRRPRRRLPAEGVDVRARGEHHHRQRRALRRDQRRGLLPRHRRRALRRAQQRRPRRRRRRRRSRLRVHDRRARRRARPRPAATSPPA